MRAVTASIEVAALGGVVSPLLHVFPVAVSVLTSALGGLYFAVQLWDRFTTHRSTYQPPQNEAVRDWHRDDNV